MINRSQLSLGFDFNEVEAKNSAMAKHDNSNIVDSISSEGVTNQGNGITAGLGLRSLQSL